MNNSFKIKKGLVVEGDARVTGAILDSTNAPGTSGQVLTSTVTGTDWKSLAEISGVDGTGTANYLSKWSDADTITNSIVYDNGTNVGIGTTSPTTRLHVFSSGIIQRLESSNSYTQLDFYNTTNTAANRNWAIGTNLYSYGDFNIMASAAYNTAPNASYTYLTIKNSGNVGIGTTSPGAKLHVSGGGQYISASASATAFLRLYSNAQTSSQFEIGQGFATATDNIAYLWNVANASMAFGTNSTERMRITSAGNVGIGTTSPAEKLEVVGNAILTISDSRFRGGDTAGRLVVSNSNTTSYITLNGSTRAVGANEIAFVANSTSAMLITSTGNVGIGTASPASKLHVGESGAPAQLWLQRTDGYNPVKLIGGTLADGSGFKITMNTTDAFAITSAGNVGIGTTSPNRLLQVAGSVYINTNLDVVGTIFGSTNKMLDQSATSTRLYDAAGTLVMSLGSGNVGIGTTAPIGNLNINSGTGDTTTQDTTLSLTRTSSTSNVLAAKLVLTAPSTYQQNLVFRIKTTASSAENPSYYSDVMTLNSSGNVGIGTTSPAYQLTLNKDDNNYLQIRSSDTGAAGIYFGRQNDSVRGGIYYDNNADALYFQTFNLNTNTVITSAGNVGIGTTAPGTKLQVAGTIRATGTTGIVDVDPLYGAFRFYNGSTFYGGFYNDAVLSAGNAVDLVSYVATGNYYIGSATTAKAVKVEQGGNVGIGTTSPTTKLDVNGVVNATSFSAGGTAGFTGTVVFATNPPGSQMLDFQGGLLVSVS